MSARKGKKQNVSAEQNGTTKAMCEKEVDKEVKYEFGGPKGVFAIMVFSHLLVWYFWVCLNHYNGKFAHPESFSDIVPFCRRMVQHVLDGAMPTARALGIYVLFLWWEFLLAILAPGPVIKGLPIPSENGRQLEYKCNAVWAWYLSLAVTAFVHMTGIFDLNEIMDLSGPLTTCSMIFGDVVSILVYVLAKVKGKEHRMSGNLVYDFFMGAWLNPRISTPFGELDLKMWAEIRISWIMLFSLTVSAAVKQYQLQGAVSPAMWFMILAHGLYTNACMKGEECIPTTFDIFYEKWGWMLIFWNFAGVPFMYCSSSIYVLKTNPQHSTPYLVFLFCLLLVAYYVWDTANSQKNRFRMQRRGTYVERRTFPQLPWGTIKNPKFIKTKQGNELLIDGWWKYARKIHYTADVTMALTWGLICGFDSFLPYFYVTYFVTFLMHRSRRDNERCAKKYGEDWKEYCRHVPYTWIPFIY